MNIKKAIQGVFLSLVFLSVIFLALQKAWESGVNNELFFLGSISGSQMIEAEPKQVESKEDPPPPPYRNWDIPELGLQAESGLALEISLNGKDKVLFNKNDHASLPIASLTKLMTAIISLENYDLSKKIKISQDAVSQDGDLGKLEIDTEMPVIDLIYITLIGSSNHSAYALSEGMDKYGFVRLMNEKARELKMENTFFAEPTGLSPENVSTAQDLSRLAKYILKEHPEIAEISRLKEYDLPNYGPISNTNELLGEVPGVIVGKTGFTLEAKGCLILILANSENDGYSIYVILGAEDRFGEMKKMIEWTKQAYVW